MKNQLRKAMVFVSLIILALQATILPIRIVYAETNSEVVDEQENKEAPASDLEETATSQAQFSPKESHIKGIVAEQIEVSFSSDQKVLEAKLTLPKEAKLLKEELPEGISVENGDKSNEWLIQSKQAQATFLLPIIFESAGNYEVTLEQATTTIEINEQEKTIDENVDQKDVDNSEESLTDESLEEKQEPEASVVDDSNEQVVNEESTENEKDEKVPKDFIENTAEVATMEAFREAVANPEIKVISVQSDLTEARSNVMSVDRPLRIQGNGHTLNFNSNGFYFELEEMNEPSTFRIENATITKVGTRPLIISDETASENWTLELEDIQEVDANTMRLAELPQGSVHFTDGKSKFTRTTSTRTFIEAKEIRASNNAKVEINRGNAIIFFSPNTVASPKIVVTDHASISIGTVYGGANAVDLRGENPTIEIDNNASFQVEDTVSLTGDHPKISIESGGNLETTGSRTEQGIYLEGVNPEMAIHDGSLRVNNERGTAIELDGALPKLTMNNANSEISTDTGAGILLEGETPKVILDESELVVNSTGDSKAMDLEGSDALLYLTNTSVFNVNGGGTGSSENILIGSNNDRPKVLVEKDSILSVTTTSGTASATAARNNVLHLRGDEAAFRVLDNSKVNMTVTSGNRRAIALTGDKANTLIDSSDLTISLKGNGAGYYSTGANNQLTIQNSHLNLEGMGGENVHIKGDGSELTIGSGSNVTMEATNTGSVWLDGSNPRLNVSGEGTDVNLSSAVGAHYTKATVYLGDWRRASPGAEVNISNKASVDLTSDEASTIGLWSESAQFNLTDQAELFVTQGNSSASAGGAAAALRFMEYGGSTFAIDNAKMIIKKAGGSTPGMRMYNDNNEIKVTNGGEFSVYNPGNGIASDGGGNTNNQGISYSRGTNNSFAIDGNGSSVKIVADSGPALDMGTDRNATLNVKKGGIFRAEGMTATAVGGIFNAGVINVNFDDPLYMNFQNNRVGGGNIFNVDNGSILKATNSDLAVWKNGADLNGDPDLNFRKIDYTFTDSNFNKLTDTSDPESLNPTVFGTEGLTSYTRLSSNNGRWAIADELRVPTNADKKLYGRVSLPLGLDSSRPAWDDEAIVTVEVTSPTGEKKEYTAKTVGDTHDSEGITIYGEEPRGGLFEIELEKPLKAGSKVRISNVELTSGELTEGKEHQILTDTVEVFPIVPPSPAQFSSSSISKDSKVIRGHSENRDVEVTATHNGEWLDTQGVTVDDDGNFILDLSDVPLEEDDEIQVFLRDSMGSAEKAGVVNPPETNNDQGNINPASELNFHDVTFEQATVLTVKDLGSVPPLDPLDPEVEVDPENKPQFPENQGMLSIDFASQLNFGNQTISATDKHYYARPQRLLNEDGTINQSEERPNYVQVSDRRPEDERSGWQLAVTQEEQFKNEDSQELSGAQLSFMNQQVTGVGGEEPSLKVMNELPLIPGRKRTLMRAEVTEGEGTWIYCFGDKDSADQSIELDVPKGANPEATSYSTKLLWELSAVPGN